MKKELKKRYVILEDTCGGGLKEFSFGLEIFDEGPELQSYIASAILELLEEDSFDDLEQGDIDKALDFVVLCEVTQITPKVKLRKETIVRSEVVCTLEVG